MTSFTSVATRRSTDQVVTQICDAVVSGQFAVGERLPPERELAEAFQVSRGVVREAIKILNGMGLVESRQGSGIFVQSDPAPIISRALTISLRREERMVQQIYEIRSALETLAAHAAARHHTATSIAQLRQAAPFDSKPPTDINLTTAASDDSRFHLAVANAADNPYLVVLIKAVQGLISEAFPITEDLREGVLNARGTHSHIADAIAAGDAELASTLMREHLERAAVQAQKSLSESAMPHP